MPFSVTHQVFSHPTHKNSATYIKQAIAENPSPVDLLFHSPMASAVAERIELAKLCRSKEWSKAIRVLDSLLSQSCAIQDLCNRAFCYSQLDLHKHVIKDCNKALQLDPKLLQAHILKGRAFSAMGRKDDALSVWEQGYGHAVCQSTDLKELLELEDLLKVAKQNDSVAVDNHVVVPPGLSSPAAGSVVSDDQAMVPAGSIISESSEISDSHVKSNGVLEKSKISEISIKSNGSIELRIKSSDQSETHNKFQNASTLDGKGNKEFDTQSKNKSSCRPAETNGTHTESRGQSTRLFIDRSESSVGSSKFYSDSRKFYNSQSFTLKDIHDELMNEAKKSKKFCVARISKNKSISVDIRLSRGIARVNDGEYASAISIFDKILQEEPDYPEALIGRGTAYAFQRELRAAIADFTKAIQSNPSAGEAWKRRGQARAALGESAEAIADLTKSLEFEPNSDDTLHERGIVNFKSKDYKAAVEDLSACVEIDKENPSAYTFLGLALSLIGEFTRAEEAHMKAIEIDQNFIEAWTHLTQFYQDMANSEKALNCIHRILQIDRRSAKAYHLRGLLLQGMGDHRNAIKELSNGLCFESSNIECLYLRASCHHAIGELKEAVKDYDAALDLELDSIEKFQLQCLSFYQKEIALYTASKFNTEFSWFDLDGDIDPLFKEYWCKRLHPKDVCEKVYRQPPLRDSLRKGKLKKQEFTLTKQRTTLLRAADSIGKKIQYNCPGFLCNRRQYRMAGLAAIEIAQRVSKVWRSLQNEWKHLNKGTSKNGKKVRRKERLSILSQNRGGAGCSTTSLFESSSSHSTVEDKSSGCPTMPWHSIYSSAIKWRQISEPCHPVVWVNKLSEEFNSGFGSKTPLTLGQSEVVRYYPYQQRTLDVSKAVMLDNKYVRGKNDYLIYLTDDEKQQGIAKAKSCSDLYETVGEDFWLTILCNSMAVDGKLLEGTRINIVKKGRSGYDFSIKTPCTPTRWDDFDLEMTSAWEALCDAYCGEKYGSTDIDVLEKVRDAILRMAYYWYNFMPLSRGTPIVGLAVLFGLLLAANMEFTGNIPEGVQVDWEAILQPDPNAFITSVKSWLYPSIKISTSWKGYPDVTSTLETTGSVVAALSNYSD